MPISTEAQRVALEHLGAGLEEAILAMASYLREQPQGAASEENIFVAKLRFDALMKVKDELVIPLIEEYRRIEEDPPSGQEMFRSMEARNSNFVARMMLGLRPGLPVSS